MTPTSLAERALALLQRTHKLRDLMLVHAAASAGYHEFVAVSAANPNGPSYRVILDEDGTPHEHVPGFDPLTLASTPVVGAAPAVAPITISPATNVLTLNPGETLDETITVTIPKNAGTPKADVYFLADTTA